MVSEHRGGLSIRRACELVHINRSWYYTKPKGPARNDTALQHEIEKIVAECDGYGYRRVTHELRRKGYRANHKRVLRIMREGEWLCRFRRSGRRTTDSDHGLPIYPNLLQGGAITGLHQVWVADITYIRLAMEFVFLAVILDAYSRRVVGWELSRSLRTQELTVPALERALASRPVPEELIHHSDQGVQYAAKAYVSRATEAGLRLSMGRRGHPEDNARAQAFFRTLKVEQVYLTEYLDFADAQRQIEGFIEDVYNRKRLHSSLGYVPPVEFEETLQAEAKRSALVGGPSAPLT
ncbi:MAG: IS3 family transposase, partial [Armatimonadota bacterium]